MNQNSKIHEKQTNKQTDAKEDCQNINKQNLNEQMIST